MGYREQTDGLRARADELEHELELAKRRIAELEGRPAPTRGLARALLGAPTRLDCHVEVRGELPQAAHEEIVEVLREQFGITGQTTSGRRHLMWTTLGASTARFVEISVSSRQDRIVVRAREQLAHVAGGLFGGIVGGGGGGGLGVILPLAIMLGGTVIAPLLAIAWLVGVYLCVRAVYRRIGMRRERELSAALDLVMQVVRRAVAGSGDPAEHVRHARVDVNDLSGEEQAEEGSANTIGRVVRPR